MIYKAGTIVEWVVSKKSFKLLEDSEEDGCPFVIEVDKEGKEIGEKRAITLYLHTEHMRVVLPKRKEKVKSFNLFEHLDI